MDFNHLIIVSLFAGFLLVVPAFLRNKHSRGSIQDTVNALGILGTFIGIAVGLFHLDFGNLQEGIPVLIQYLAYGFIASIAGFGVSLAVKHTNIYGIKDGEDLKDVSDKDLLLEIRDELRKVNINLSGEGETTLVTQIQKMRTSTADKLDELKKSFDDFAKQMAENNMKSLIEAINKVMEDFNTKINDQLGQSFKELGNSVRALVEWQQNYISTVQQATEALGSAQESLKNSSVSLQDTSEKVSQIAENNALILELNKEFASVVGKLNQILESSVSFTKEMESLAKELNGSGDTIRKEVTDIVGTSIKEMKTHADDISKSINAIVDTTMKSMNEKNTSTLNNLDETTRKTLSSFGQHMASISEKLGSDFATIQKLLAQKSNGD